MGNLKAKKFTKTFQHSQAFSQLCLWGEVVIA